MPTEARDFGYALRRMKAGLSVTRKCWNRSDRRLYLKYIEINGAVLAPIIFEIDGDRIEPWTHRVRDMLATDWREMPLDEANDSGVV